MATWKNLETVFTDFSTPDLIGPTTDFTWEVLRSGSNVILVADITNHAWEIKVSARILF